MSANCFKPNPFSADFQLLMSCVESNQENFNFFIRLMRRNVVIPFIGAGFSKNFQYPLWEEFLGKQADIHHLEDVKKAKDNREYEKAATLLEQHLGRGMEYTLMQTFGDHIYKAASYDGQLEYLPKIFRNLIITTNFDEVIEMLYAKVNSEHIETVTPRTLQDVKLSHKRIACGEPTLIKLHGSVASREFILTEQAYNDVYGRYALDLRLPLPSFLRDVLLSRIILFIGCSLMDDRTLRVIEQSQIDGSISFALLELPEKTENKAAPWKPTLIKEETGQEVEVQEFAERKDFLNAHNIVPIWFPYQQYDALKIFLSEISNQIYPEYKLSITGAQVQVDNLLSKGAQLGQEGHIEQAFRCYTNALEIIKTNSDAFVGKSRLDNLKKISSFYELNGYGLECKEIIKECISLILQIYSRDSIELAMYYHNIGYIYERHLFYRLQLKAMKKSQQILQKCIETGGETTDTLNAAAMIYMSLAYTFEANGDKESAKEWYKKAEDLLLAHERSLNDDEKSFIYNGLHRYYKLLGDTTASIAKLEKALELRKRLLYHSGILSDDERRGILNHIVNTHSNKIRIYLHQNKHIEAEKEFLVCKSNCPIWERPEYLSGAKRRILTDYGDILMQKKNPEAACKEYKRALQYRKYTHSVDMDDALVAQLYFKIADSLTNIPNRGEEAMEYLVQAFVIYEKIQGDSLSNDCIATKKRMDELCETLSLNEEMLNQRLDAQRYILKYRHDERWDNMQEELIQYFDL